MQTTTNKIETNKTLNELLKFEVIKTLVGKEWQTILDKADAYYIASENYKTQLIKDELKKENIEFKDKYEYFLTQFGTKKTQSALYIKIGKTDKQIISDYENSTAENLRSLNSFEAFLKPSDTETNMTKTGITEETETKKPLKFATEKNNIEVKVNGQITEAEKQQVIEFINSLQTV